MADVVLAVDIGGTKTAAALVDGHGAILAADAAPTPASAGPEAVVATTLALAGRLVERTDAAGVRAVGIGTAGVVDASTGTIVSSTDTFVRWAGTPLAALVGEGLAGVGLPGRPVDVQNDVDAHALGEARYGAARGAPTAVVVAVGTGIGAGIVVDGRVLRGAHHVAGELGHMPVAAAAHLRCPCGRPGHLEALGSGVGMHRHYLSLGGDAAVVDARGVASLGQEGDALARRALEDSAAAVGRALAGVATLLDPDCLVVTGGVAGIGPAWWEPMERTFRAEVIDLLADVPLRPGELGGDAPLLGAASAAWNLVVGVAA